MKIKFCYLILIKMIKKIQNVVAPVVLLIVNLRISKFIYDHRHRLYVFYLVILPKFLIIITTKEEGMLLECTCFSYFFFLLIIN
jgi:hypothetical protein